VQVVVVVLIVAALAGGVYLSWYLKKKRREALAAMARQLGLQYSSDDTVGCLGFPFRLLTRGDGRGTENVMWGTWQGIPMTEFDYWYYEESTDSEGRTSKSYYRFSCAVTEIGAACSPLTIDRENLLTRLADHMGMHDIEFELDAFNKAFNVKSHDRKFANDMIDARMMQWLIGVDGAFEFELSAKWVMVFSKKRAPSELVPLLGTAQQFLAHVPHVVYDLYPVSGSG
jgi:hypothetical protein